MPQNTFEVSTNKYQTIPRPPHATMTPTVSILFSLSNTTPPPQGSPSLPPSKHSSFTICHLSHLRLSAQSPWKPSEGQPEEASLLHLFWEISSYTRTKHQDQDEPLRNFVSKCPMTNGQSHAQLFELNVYKPDFLI